MPSSVGIISSSRVHPVVTGGTLTSDATYYYRTFTANGTLSIANMPMTMDIFAIGGGGCGGTGYLDSGAYYDYNYGYLVYAKIMVTGGGGAGGSYFSPYLNKQLRATDYAIVVGAGGTWGGYSTGTLGTAGTSSSFGAEPSYGGNPAAGYNNSYGGHNTLFSGALPSGYTGYTGSGFTGGGGAGAGGNASLKTGGAGVNAFGTIYGVGGSTNDGFMVEQPFRPPYVATYTSANAAANTGNGGTGNGGATGGGYGGSGIVIARYLKTAVGG